MIETSRYEPVPVVHSTCGGQGCYVCDGQGEEWIMVDVLADTPAE